MSEKMNENNSQSKHHGFLNIYKEAGHTSHDVVARLRKIFDQRKIGHTGTLDPDAEGVLPVGLGKATKAVDLFSEADKSYRCILLLGMTTDTQDTSGTVLSRCIVKPYTTDTLRGMHTATYKVDVATQPLQAHEFAKQTLYPNEVNVTEEEVRKAILSFQGEYEQIPPMYSAIKVKGKKLYELARQGKEIEREPRKVRIDKIEIQEIKLPRVTMHVTCSKGTYIRTLCYDIGEYLGCGGCMEKLVRTRVGSFGLADSLKLSEIEEKVKQERADEIVIHIDSLFLYPKVKVRCDFQKAVENGNRLPVSALLEWKDDWKKEPLRLYDSNGKFAGIYEWQEQGDLKPERFFLEP